MLKGIDISYCQAGLSIPDTGADFCIIKATEGLGIVDDYCDGFVQQCIALGKPWGFYHFARPNGGAAEARYFYSNTKNYTGYGIPVLDFEDERNDNNYIDEFVKEYHAITGIYPLIYMNSNFVNNYGYGSDYVKQNCGLWLAGYPTLRTDYPDDANCPYNTNGWTLAAWQFTDNLYVAGMHVDGDFFYGDTNAWNLYATGGRSSVPASAPAPADNMSGYTDWQLARKVVDGEFGDGRYRHYTLGSRYDAVQNDVNLLLNGSNRELANAVIAGELGNGDDRRYILGARYSDVQNVVNQLL